MAVLRTFHPCAFRFQTTDIRRVGDITDGGTALDGTSEQIEADGGGYWQADFSDGSTRTKEQGNAWRALTDLDAGEKIILLGCSERRFQPVGPRQTVPHDDQTPFDDGMLYTSPGAQYATTADAALRATSLLISGASELALIGGELFSILHPNWGWRWYRIRQIDGNAIYFRTPLREAVTAGTALEFDTPRCQMILAQKVSNKTSLGRYTSCAISLREDMSPPADA